MIVPGGGPTEIISSRRSGCLAYEKSLVNTPYVSSYFG